MEHDYYREVLSFVTDHDIQLVQAEVKAISCRRKWSYADEEDFTQDVLVSLLEQEKRGVKSKKQDMAVGYLRVLIKRMLMDRKRKDERRISLEFNSELVEGSSNGSNDDS